ncbi:MAG: DUF302 domain-containing protein [Chitinivibrionales bacterium]|nr:DUF302 domain-containing protein [Chitinivibrionales bacterium]MBD3395287.1 DUF302 domain-containing protein [Chitinivibrionales bacterium]
MIEYGVLKELDRPVDDVLAELPGTLKEEGFGVLTTIQLHEKLKEKLGVDFPRYVILGVCNPPFAHKALKKEKNLGLMLPCNMIVYENNGGSIVAAVKPTVTMQAVGNDSLQDIAVEIESRLARVVEAL